MVPQGIVATTLGAVMALAGSTPGVAEPVEEHRALYEVAETAGAIAVDSSTYANDGELLGGVTRRNGSYRFHPVPRDDRYDRIRVPADPSLNPKGLPFSYGARIRVRPTAQWSHGEMAVIRHGDKDTPGGDYKLELRRLKDGTAAAVCAMRDDEGGSAYVQGSGLLETLNDGVWHEVTCARVDDDTVALIVDGHVTERPTDGTLGSIRSRDPLLIGCQPFANRPDLRFREQLNGALDDIHVSVQTEPATEPETT